MFLDGLVGVYINKDIYVRSAGKFQCDVIKVRLNTSLSYKFPFPILLWSHLFRRIFMTSHIKLYSALSISSAEVTKYYNENQ